MKGLKRIRNNWSEITDNRRGLNVRNKGSKNIFLNLLDVFSEFQKPLILVLSSKNDKFKVSMFLKI